MKFKLKFAILIIIPVLSIGVTAFLFLSKSSKKEIILLDDLTEKETMISEKKVEDDILDTIAVVNKKSEKPEKIDIQSEKTEEEEIKKSSLEIIKKPISTGFQKSSGRKIDTIIIHSSYDAFGNNPFSLSGLMKEYVQYGVSPHYLIDREGIIYQLVEEKNVAYHAGVSKVPDGRTDVNNFSIGIELMNTQDKKFTQKQYDSLRDILDDIKGRYGIKYVLGHNQVASGRKSDPWSFDWNEIK